MRVRWTLGALALGFGGLCLFLALLWLYAYLVATPAADTTGLSIGALTVTLVLAALAFQYAGLLDPAADEVPRWAAIRAGEFLLFAGLLFLCSTAIRAAAYHEWRLGPLRADAVLDPEGVRSALLLAYSFAVVAAVLGLVGYSLLARALVDRLCL